MSNVDKINMADQKHLFYQPHFNLTLDKTTGVVSGDVTHATADVQAFFSELELDSEGYLTADADKALWHFIESAFMLDAVPDEMIQKSKPEHLRKIVEPTSAPNPE